MYKVVYLWMVRHVFIRGVTVPSSGDLNVLLLGGIMQTKSCRRLLSQSVPLAKDGDEWVFVLTNTT